MHPAEAAARLNLQEYCGPDSRVFPPYPHLYRK
jgi:hypothetical protein